MKKLSKRAIDFIELFLKTDINNITLNRHDIDVLYAHYKYSWFEFDKMDHELEKYKSRIEKAVEYVEEAKEQDFMWTPIFMKELLNILNGRSDE